MRQEWPAEQRVPLQGRESDEEGGKRKPPSRGLGGVLCPLPPPLPPALHPMHQITTSPPSECRGISNASFGPALTFATVTEKTKKYYVQTNMIFTSSEVIHNVLHISLYFCILILVVYKYPSIKLQGPRYV